MDNLTTDTVEDLATVDNSYWVGKLQSLESLEQKTFYKTLIEEGVLKDYMFSLVMGLTDPSTVQDGTRSIVMEKLIALANLQEYLMLIRGRSMDSEDAEARMEKLEREHIEKIIKLQQAYEIAKTDADFRNVILDGYLTDYANDRVSLIANDTVMRSGGRTNVLEALSGVSLLKNFFVSLENEKFEDDEDEVDAED